MSDKIRTPPHSDEAERGVIGAVLVDNGRLDYVRDQLSPGDFYRERHRHIFRAMTACADKGQSIDVVTVGDQLSEDGNLEAVGGASFLARISNEVPSAANVRSYVDRVRRYSNYQDAVATLGKFVERAYDPTDDFPDFAAEVSSAVQSLVDEGEDDRLKKASEVAPLVVDQAEEWSEDDAAAGLSTGIEAIDHKFKLEPARLYVEAGRPGMGKTALAQNMQRSLSIDRDIPTAIFSMEMSQAQIGFRYICQEAQVDQRQLRRGTLGESGWRSLIDAAGKYQKAPIWQDDTPSMSLPRLRAKTRRLVSEHGVQCVFVDYLQMMKWPARADTKNQAIGRLAKGLKGLAKECDIPVVALAQVNRNVEDRENKRPVASDLRASGMIEEYADVIAMLYRESFYDDEASDEGEAELVVRKNRDGGVGKAKMWWVPEYTLFRDIDRHHGGCHR